MSKTCVIASVVGWIHILLQSYCLKSLETDSTILQTAVLSPSMDHSSSGVNFKEIRVLAREKFSPFECFDVSSTHEVAALGLNQSPGSENVWEYPISAFVSSRVACISDGREVN